MAATKETKRRVRLIALAAAALLFTAGEAAALRLPPQKDSLFAYPGVIETRDGGDFVVVDYDKQRDIHQRDEVPEKKVQWKYVSTGVNWQQGHYDYDGGNGRKLRFVGVGNLKREATMIVIFLHGQNGTRFLGADDWSFGGNFNRIKNLAVLNGGLYLTPDFTDFADRGAAEIAGLVEAERALSPTAPIILACGSQGGMLCWRTAADAKAGNTLSGLILLGSLWDDGFFKSPAFRRRAPVFFGHGSRDPVFAIDRQEAFYHAIRKRAPGYPVQFRRFETGNHGTPIRMADWREMLNWIFAKL